MTYERGLGAEDASVENIDDALYEIDELLERWNNRLTIENLALARRYDQSALHIAFLWHRPYPNDVSEYFCSIFQRELLVGG